MFEFTGGVDVEDIWFERSGDNLVVRLHGSEDSVTFENWYHANNPHAYVKSFLAGGQTLDYSDVAALITAMQPHISDLGDGTSAYDILPGEAPQTVLDAIDAAWA